MFQSERRCSLHVWSAQRPTPLWNLSPAGRNRHYECIFGIGWIGRPSYRLAWYPTPHGKLPLRTITQSAASIGSFVCRAFCGKHLPHRQER